MTLSTSQMPVLDTPDIESARPTVPVHVRHFGGAQEVGGSSYEIRCWGVTILIDAGGRPKVSAAPFPDWTDAHVPDLALVTHAHFDHVAGLPLLCRHFENHLDSFPIYMTPLTRDLAEIILRDAARVMQQRADQEAEKHGAGHKAARPPAYTEDDVEAMLDTLLELPPYSEVSRVFADRAVKVTVKPVVAGHIPGAATYLVSITKVHTADADHLLDNSTAESTGSPSETIRLVLMGDIGDDATLAIDAIDVPAILAFRPHLVVSESTYGVDDLPPITEERDRLRRSIAEVVRRGGNVIVPAFALGRSTEVALILRHANARWMAYCSETLRDPTRFPDEDDPIWDVILTDSSARWEQYCASTGHHVDRRPPSSDPIWDVVDRTAMLPCVMCYIDGMARDVADVIERHRHALSDQVQRKATSGGAIYDAYVGVVRYGGAAMSRVGTRPFVAVATSGMMTDGPVLSWLRQMCHDPRNALLLSGYQDEEAPGYRVQRLVHTPAAARVLTVTDKGGNREELQLKLQLGAIRLRAHASGHSITQILALLAPQHIILTHGDPGATAALRDALCAMATAVNGQTAIWTPANGQDLRLDVVPDSDSVASIDLWRAAADRSVDKLMRGAHLADVVQSLRASPRAVDTARDLALDVFGVPPDRLRRRIAIRCVTEVLEDYEATWFERRDRFGVTAWEAKRSAVAGGESSSGNPTTNLYWDAVEVPPAEAGIAVVRYLSHYPRLALLGPHEQHEGDVVHPAVVALSRAQRVSTRDVILTLSGTPIGENAWGSSDKWASLMRRVLTDLQLAAESMLADPSWRAELLRRNALDASTVAIRREVWESVVSQASGYAALPVEGHLVLSAIRDAVIGSGIISTVILSLRQLRSLFLQERLLLPRDPYEVQLDRLLRGVNGARAMLGMSSIPATQLITQYPFDVRRVIGAVNELVSPVRSDAAAPLDETERMALALYQADVFIRVAHEDLRRAEDASGVLAHDSTATDSVFSFDLIEADGGV